MAPKRRGDTDASEVVAFLKTYGMRPFLAHPAGQQHGVGLYPAMEQQLQVDLSVTPPWRRIVQDTPAVEPEPIPDEGTHHAHPEDQASLTQLRGHS